MGDRSQQAEGLQQLKSELQRELAQDFHDLLKEFARVEAVGTDELLSAVLPLFRQTLELHDEGKVAPLDGYEHVRVYRRRLFLGPGAAQHPNWNPMAVNQIQGTPLQSSWGDGIATRPLGGLAALRQSLDDEDPAGRLIAGRGRAPTKPCFMLDYRAWEHAVGNHDPLTDIFSLGMLAASLATGLDFTEEGDLAEFARHRRHLVQLNPRLHPIVADILCRMTELDRRDRIQELARVIHGLEHHRQLADPKIGVESEAPLAREGEILKELRGRLYDLSRRNKLLHHKPSNAELNLTEASTPIVLHVDAIRPEQLLTWSGEPANRIAAGEPIALQEFIRFEEMTHAPAVLDKIRAQARRDKTEFGFSQLRLVICFLRWRNLKDDPETPINSPLLLLPVELKKRRGVRDSYDLQALASEAEVNPTLRRYLKLVYNVDLPGVVDIADPGAIDALHRLLQDQITRSEPGVKLEKISTPNIRSMHQRAQRRVDLYRARNRPSGGQKRLGDLIYSYNRTQYRPLGAQLFKRFVEPSQPPKRPQGLKGAADQLVDRGKGEQDGRQMSLSIDMEELRRAAVASKPRESEGARQAIGRADQRLWAFDLCSVTLANFNYRKMSLVRDFDALLDKGVGDLTTGATVADALGGRSTAFEKLFADGPKPMAEEVSPPVLLERFPVVPADPTQEEAVARSRTGESYVIQGPPGTGKSQTIANLIADFLGRGKRVLFVCEKRAALDVVYHRLESLKLHRLCARVHDSQDDKKSFILDLKTLFEGWLDAAPNEAIDAKRREAVSAVESGIAAFEAIDQDMMTEADGEKFHMLVSRAAAALRPAPLGAEALDDEADAPKKKPRRRRGAMEGSLHKLSQAEFDLLPSLREWRSGRIAALEAEAALRRIDPNAPPILATHPARFVSVEASSDPQLFERLEAALEALEPHLRGMRAAMGKVALPKGQNEAPLSALFAQIDYANRLRAVAMHGDLRIFDRDSGVRQRFDSDLRLLDLARENLALAQSQTVLWRDKLSAVETDAALRLALQHEGSMLSFLSGPWRTVKAEVTQRTSLGDLSIKPTIVQLLTDLSKEHEAAAEVEQHLRQLASHLGLTDGEKAIEIVEEIDRKRPREGREVEPLMEQLALSKLGEAKQRVLDLAEMKEAADAARASLAACFEGLETLPMSKAFDALAELEKKRETLPAFAPALRALAQAPDSVRTALRCIGLPVAHIEEEIVNRAVERALAVRPSARESSGPGLDAQAAQIDEALGRLREANAEALLDGARRRFVEHISLTQRLELELDPERQADRRKFVEARQDLERELAKSMRFRSIRELMAGPAGHLIRDLKPIWLMSPLSVADILPLQPDLFDVVIFDEASQVPVEEAAPTLFRAPQAIVVGDEKQLPPTNFFGSSEAEGEPWEEAAPEDGAPPLDLDADSFLGQAARSLPSTMLGWHYRSRAEELIAFSNALFYGGRLISIPSATKLEIRDPIEAAEAKDGGKLWEEILARPISWHRTPFGVYERQRNTGEAEYVAELVRGLLKAGTGKSIGVVAFSEAQQTEIERALDRLAKADAKFRNLYEAELEREEDGQFAGLFVKNLENVQGDERDIIIVSVCYAPDANGRMRMNFGPINRAGGEKRLNVIFSRAKDRLALVSTIAADAITNDYNTGALCLKTYIRYAEAVSRGDRDAMLRCLSHVAPQALAASDRPHNPLADRIAQALRERGWQVETALGQSAFVCDLAIRPPEPAKGRKAKGPMEPLAVLIDGPAHFATENLLERHVVRPAVLKAFGWRSMTVLGIDWRRDPNRVIQRIEAAVKGK